MKVLLINGSPRHKGNTSIALNEVAKTLEEGNIETETIWIGTKPVRGCIACNKCAETGNGCAFRDELYDEIIEKAAKADGFIIGSPTYYGGPNGSLCALLDRVFYSNSKLFTNKPAASVIVCRRGGASAAFDRINKYFLMNNMPVVPSQYWNSVHGRLIGDAVRDLEGLQTMRTLAKNMIWMLSAIHKEGVNMPVYEDKVRTNL